MRLPRRRLDVDAIDHPGYKAAFSRGAMERPVRRVRHERRLISHAVQAPGRAVGWLTTDADEIARRRERAAAERMRIDAGERSEPVFATFTVRSAAGAEYRVEIRSLTTLENSCSCPDFRTNGLGTCKHIEAVTRAAAEPRRPHGAACAEGIRRAPRSSCAVAARPRCASGCRRLRAGVPAVLRRCFDDRRAPSRAIPSEAVPGAVRALAGSGDRCGSARR